MSNPIEDFGAQVVNAVNVPSGDDLTPEDVHNLRLRKRHKEKEDAIDLCVDRWMYRSATTFQACTPTTPKLPGGMYYFTQFPDGNFGYTQQPINVDELLNFPDSLNQSILDEIADFWTRGSKFKHYGFLHRRGYMFYGPHGSGKSCLVQQIIKHIIDNDGIVMACERPTMLALGLKLFREIEPDRHVVCLFEDIDAIIKKHGESEILSILDGENQVDSVLNIATTNYPETLDQRLVARPRRFDRVLKIGWPSEDVRRFYFKHKLKIEDTELDNWVTSTDKFSFAACAELVISVKCLGKDFNESIKILRDLSTGKPSSKDFEIGGGSALFSSKQ